METNILTRLTADHVARHPGRAAIAAPCGGDKWRDISWREFGGNVKAAAAALVKLGVETGGCVATYSANRPESLYTDFACYAARAVSVSIYATSSAEQVAYIVNDCKASVLVAGNATQYQIAREVQRTCPCLKHIVVVKKVVLDPDDTSSMLWADLVRLGNDTGDDVKAEVARRTADAKPDDIATLVYTSGTTGEPKGAILTHANYDAALLSHRERLTMLNPDKDVSMAFLPLSHIFEKGFTYVCLMLGIKVAVNRDPKAIQDTIKQVHPTLMCAVPRFWEKVHSAVVEKIAAMNPVSRKMVKEALKTGLRRNLYYKRLGLEVPKILEWRYQMMDRLIFSQLRSAIGIDKPNFFPTAGAPVSPELVEFFNSCGIFLMVGYGLSETTATVTCLPETGYVIGSVGTTIPDVQVRIGDNNEVQVKAPTVMRGYYNKPEATAEAFTADGWLRTGDAGRIDEGGNLFITDRIKDLFKTSNGKYIAPQMIETLVGSDPMIEEVAVIGDSRKFVTALIVPAFAAVRSWAAKKGLKLETDADVAANPEVHAMIERHLEQLQKGLAGYERIKRFTLLPRGFSMETGELTNTLKVRRRVVAEHFAKEIKEMYK